MHQGSSIWDLHERMKLSIVHTLREYIRLKKQPIILFVTFLDTISKAFCKA